MQLLLSGRHLLVWCMLNQVVLFMLIAYCYVSFIVEKNLHFSWKIVKHKF